MRLSSWTSPRRDRREHVDPRIETKFFWIFGNKKPKRYFAKICMILFHENFRSFSSSPFLAAMFKRRCPLHPFQVYCPDSSLWLFCPGFLLTAVLSQVPSPAVLSRTVLSLIVLSYLFCPGCPVLQWLSSSGSSVKAVLFAVLSWLSRVVLT
jgi:hypothetical protein